MRWHGQCRATGPKSDVPRTAEPLEHPANGVIALFRRGENALKSRHQRIIRAAAGVASITITSGLTAVGMLGAFGLLAGCEGGPASDITIEALPEVRPSLPAVPQIPPPPHPVTYGDGSYSVYGLRARLNNTIDQSHAVTGYVVEIYEPPECPADEPCPTPSAPHFFLSDTVEEQERSKWLRVVGYAENHAQVEEAIEANRRGRYERPDPVTGQLPIPVEMAQGAKLKVTGQFTHVSGTGFSDSAGLLEFRDYEVLEGGS